MRIIEHELPQDHQIIFHSCWHEGSVLKYQKVIDQIIEEIVSVPNTYLVHLGDWAEALLIDDPRYNPEADEGYSPLKQYQTIKHQIAPIRDKILVALHGNHDKRLFKFGNLVRDYLCFDPNDPEEITPIPYGTFACKIIIKNQYGIAYKIYATHGRKSISSAADDPARNAVNRQLILKRHLKNKAGDCLFMVKGHNHQLISLPPAQGLYLTNHGTKLEQNYTGSWLLSSIFVHPDFRFYAGVGCAYRTFADPELEIPTSSYAEEADYDPVELGYLRATIRGPRVVGWERVVVG